MTTKNWYVDTNLASGNNDGTTTDDAWQSLATALEFTGYDAAQVNKIWIKRDSSHTMGADINFGDDGFDDKPILFIGWPRAAIPNTTITQSDCTNGSNIVDNVVGITPDRETHVGRFMTGADGAKYLITAVLWEAVLDGIEDGVSEFTVGSKLTNTTQTKYGKVWAYTDDGGTAGTIQYYRHPSTAWVENDNLTDAAAGDGEITAGGETAVGFLIDRGYAGGTVTGVDGKFQIEADDDYTEAQAISDAAFTIKLSTWTDDADALVQFDGNSANFCIIEDNDNYYGMKNFEFLNFADASNGTLYVKGGIAFTLNGCLLSILEGINENILNISEVSECIINRCIFEGGGSVADTSQQGLYVQYAGATLKDCAIIGLGDCGIRIGYYSRIFLENVNIGVEAPINDDSITIFFGNIFITGRDVNLDGTNGYLLRHSGTTGTGFHVSIENYQKVLGAHKTWYSGGEYISTVLTGATTPNKKLSDTVLKITPNIDNTEFYIDDWVYRIPLGEINADSGSQTFKFWLFNNTGVTLNTAATDDVYLQAEYVKSYDDTTEYTMAIATSTETGILQNGGVTDWDYLTVACNPATASKVRLWLCCRVYDAQDIFIDPQVVIT